MNRNNKFKFIIIIAVIALVFTAYYAESQQNNMPKAFAIKDNTYKITSYAYTTQQQEKGLMNVSVTNNTFMLFYFRSLGIFPFWMKDTYTQLDIIWINYNSTSQTGKIVYFANATPCINYSKNQTNCIIYTPISYANYVIETKSGFIQQNQINIGTNITFIYK